jgi:acyl dehydratase
MSPEPGMSPEPDVSAAVAFADVEVGTELPSQNFTVHRADLVRYAGASGDFNIIHWNERFATSVGLPNVIAHGMLTMALAGRVVTDWIGDPGALLEYGVRFTRPVVVPDDEAGARVTVVAKVTAKNDDGTVVVTVTASSSDVTVLGKATAIVRLA